jgi:hypothetical protein
MNWNLVGSIYGRSWQFLFLIGWFLKNLLLWNRICLLMNWDEMSNFHRGPSKETSYQISVHLGKQIQRRRLFRNQPIRNKNCLWRPCLLMDGDEMSNLQSLTHITVQQLTTFEIYFQQKVWKLCLIFKIFMYKFLIKFVSLLGIRRLSSVNFSHFNLL